MKCDFVRCEPPPFTARKKNRAQKKLGLPKKIARKKISQKNFNFLLDIWL